DLKKKITEYLENGVKLVWVVRMDVPRHVEVYTPDGKKEIFGPGTQLLAPGILANPVPVEALYEPGAARETVLRNTLARAGYSGLEEVFEEGKAEGKAEGEAHAALLGLRTVYTARFGAIPAGIEDALLRQPATALVGWMALFATATAEEIQRRLTEPQRP
ncbi:MAG TPA: Uma2 family endonuclease, partial [Myxococcota bacterium]|nr:Uma2 family endonuclease [Myxococcota bacterium]